MMKKIFSSLVFWAFVWLGTACSNDSGPEEKMVDPVDFTDQLNDWNWEKIEPGQLYVIRSAEEYTFSGKAASTSLPEIDFTKYSLLAVRGEANKGIAEMTKKLIVSETGNYRLDIQITLNDATVMENWHLGVLVPVIPKDKKVGVEISYLSL